nr:MAG TPA: hypothetical protein [Caudoviricetes sp.]
MYAFQGVLSRSELWVVAYCWLLLVHADLLETVK